MARVGLPADQHPAANASHGLAPWLSRGLLAPFFPSGHLRFFRRGGDPSRTQLRDPGDELHRNRFGEGKMDRPLSSALLIAARTCSSFGRSTSGCAAMYSSTDFGTLCFIPLILCFGMRVFLAVIHPDSSLSGDPFHTASVWVAQLGRRVDSRKCLVPGAGRRPFGHDLRSGPLESAAPRLRTPGATRCASCGRVGRRRWEAGNVLYRKSEFFVQQEKRPKHAPTLPCSQSYAIT